MLSGINTVSFYGVGNEGELKKDEKDKKRTSKITSLIKERILRFKKDDYDKFGIIILSDDGEISNRFYE